MKQIIGRLKSVDLLHLVWVIILSEIFTAALSIAITRIGWGRISQEVILVGVVDSFVVSAIVGSLLIYLFRRFRETEKQYRILADNTWDAICLVDMKGSLLEINMKMEEMSGYTREELLRMNFFQLCPPQESAAVFEQEIRIGAPYEVSFVRKGGDAFPADIAVALAEYDRRQTALITLRDITSRKIMEKDLDDLRLNLERLVSERTAELGISNTLLKQEIKERQSAEERLGLLRKAVESIPIGITITNVERKIVYANPAEADIHGYSVEELIDSPVGIFAPPETWRPLDFKALHLRSAWQRESTNLRKDGSPFPVLLTSVPVADDRGAPVAMITLCEDISERKKTERALGESEERFRQLFEQNEDALFLFEPETLKILDANPAAVALYGYEMEEFVGREISLFAEPDAYPGLLRRTDREAIQIDGMVNRRKDGSEIVVSARGKIITLKESEVLYCSFRDVTEKMRLEEEAKFIQAKLIQANKMTALGTLVSGVAHEINNPNNYILFNAQLLSGAWDDIVNRLSESRGGEGDFTVGGLPFSEMREIIPKLLSGITEGSRRIKNIVAGLKSFARRDDSIRAGRVDVNKVVVASAAILDNQIKKFTDRFHLDLAEGLPSVGGSAQQLEQVVINLVMNALHALPDKGKGISISTSFDNNSRCVIIRVRDEGMGMTPEVMERITEPFFTTRLGEGGTGLGLSISYSIVKDHRGSLKFDSRPGGGTTVTVALPEEDLDTGKEA